MSSADIAVGGGSSSHTFGQIVEMRITILRARKGRARPFPAVASFVGFLRDVVRRSLMKMIRPGNGVLFEFMHIFGSDKF